VPSVMQVMLDDVAPKLAKGVVVLSETIDAHGLPEGAYAEGLGAMAKETPEITIGSYPRMIDGQFVNQIVLRSKDAGALARATRRVRELLAEVAARHRL
jgi:molybdopterin-biosynthesis enzyme MoeA-like protein